MKKGKKTWAGKSIRKVWEIKPITRVKGSKKVYDRKRAKREEY